MAAVTSPSVARPLAAAERLARQASSEKAYAAERGIAAIRVAIITFNTIVYSFFWPHEGTYPWLAYATIVGANAYGLGVLAFQPYKRYPVMLSSYFTSVLDAGFIAVWLFATGGVASPFAPLWYVSVAAVAFRYGARETFFAAALYGVSYVTMLGLAGQLAGHEALVVTRVVYIGFVAAVGALVASESVTQYREKVEARALAEELRESEERFRRLSDAASEGVVIQADGKIVDCNEALARMLRVPRDQLIGRSVLDLVAPESRATLIARMSAPAAHDAYEIMGLRADGSTFPVEIAARDLPWEGRTVRVAAVRDLTERKTNQRLQELDKLKTQFINNAAHELATPLTPIKLQSHLLRVGSLGPLNEKQTKAMNVVARNVDHLGLLVKDVLDSARVQGGTLTLRVARVDLARVAHEAVESFDESARAQGVDLAVATTGDLALDADDARLTQVLFNLLNNALKFTPRGGRIEVDASRVGREVRVRVKDSGSGMRPEDVPRLFQPFSQVHNVAEQPQRGTGLGLYISRGIVEAHGGRISAMSEGLGRGSTFEFSLPAA